MKSENAFVLGNGITRAEIELEPLRPHGKIYGCNNLYLDFVPDVLVAVDTAISTHIHKMGYCEKNILYTRDPVKKFGKSNKAYRIEKNHAYSSGPVAMTLACQDNHRYIYMIGFDLMGIGKVADNNKRRFNNIYADKEFYKKSKADETYYGNWVQQVESIMKEYGDRTFIRVNPHMDYSPREWDDCANYKTMDVKQFLQMINT